MRRTTLAGMNPEKRRAASADEVVETVQNGMRLFIHGAAATPSPLLEALSRRVELEGVTLYHLHLEGPCLFADAAHHGRFHSVSLFFA